jgi:3-hydroxyisobutyrate dehydrogenase
MAAGSLFIDHTTVSAKATRELAQAAAERGIGYVDAPVSGGQAGAEEGRLSVMCGGREDDYARAEAVVAPFARICRRLGEVGAGQVAKMANQIAIAGLVQGLSEALNLATRMGLDGRALVEVISQGAAGSWQMANRHATMLDGEFEHGFAVDWMRKDLAICLDAGREAGVSLPVTALVDQFYAEVQAMGGGRWDTSSLFARIRRLNAPE